jgi:hypothetical protein
MAALGSQQLIAWAVAASGRDNELYNTREREEGKSRVQLT